MEITLHLSKKKSILIPNFNPNENKICSCGVKIHFAHYFKEGAGIMNTPIDLITPLQQNLLEKQEQIWVPHYPNCPTWIADKKNKK